MLHANVVLLTASLRRSSYSVAHVLFRFRIRDGRFHFTTTTAWKESHAPKLRQEVPGIPNTALRAYPSCVKDLHVRLLFSPPGLETV